MSSGSGTQITTPGNTVLKAGTGTVGSPTTPLDVNIGGQIAVYTPPGNIYIVGSQTTELALSANTGSSSTYGESVTFTATISDTNTGTGTPTGNVEFYDGSSDLGAGTLLSSGGTSATWSFTTSTLTVGIQSISAYFTPSGNSVGSSSSSSLTVTPAALTLTADSTSKTYGQTATFAGTSFTETGLVNGDTITGVAETSNGAAVSATVGTYNIVPFAAAGTDLSDYTITYVDGTLTVNTATLTITANSTSKTYGQMATFGTTAFIETGLVTANGDTIIGVTETSTGSPISATVGSYNIVPGAATGIGLANYTITYVNGTLTVSPASLTITANKTSKTYGTLETFSGTAFTETGLVTANGDTITGVTETSTGTPVSASVGTYPIVPSAATGTGLSNYTISYVNGTLTVNPASLTITANNDSKTYGTLKSFSRDRVHRDWTGDGQRRLDHRRDRDQHRVAGVGDGGHLSHRAQYRERDWSCQLHHHLRQRHADGQPGPPDDHGHGQQDLRHAEGFQRHSVHRDRPGYGQRRHHHRRDRNQHRDAGVGDGRYLSHRGQRRDWYGAEQLHHHLRQRHADGQPGPLDHHGQQRQQDLRHAEDLRYARRSRKSAW